MFLIGMSFLPKKKVLFMNTFCLFDTEEHRDIEAFLHQPTGPRAIPVSFDGEQAVCPNNNFGVDRSGLGVLVADRTATGFLDGAPPVFPKATFCNGCL